MTLEQKSVKQAEKIVDRHNKPTENKIELFKDKNMWVIRNGLCRINCVCDKITIKQLTSLHKQITKILSKKTDYCISCKADKPISLLGTSKLIIKKGKYTIK